MLLDRYQSTVEELFEKVRTSQREAIIAAGELIAQAVINEGCVHIFDTGHIIDSELIYRGGGLLLYKEFKYSLSVTDPVRQRDRSRMDTSMEGLAGYALKASGAMPGDVMIIGSVSGKTLNVIDLALSAKTFGMKTIALTSVSYSSKVSSEHSSGKRLFECADVVLDNCAPPAEAMMEVKGLPARFGAASGLSAAYIMWSVTSVVVEKLLASGITPSVLKSHNYEDGPAFNEELRKIYNSKGY
jgi:uncharacterized phosphosugar-binding protein